MYKAIYGLKMELDYDGVMHSEGREPETTECTIESLRRIHDHVSRPECTSVQDQLSGL